MQDYRYTSVHDIVLPAIRQVVEGVIATNKLDAMIYPTSGNKTPLIDAPPPPANPRGGAAAGGGTNFQNFTGFPDLIVPAGFTGGGENLPVGLSFVGPAFSEGKLISFAYSFEQATHARRRPVNTPALKDDTVNVKGE